MRDDYLSVAKPANICFTGCFMQILTLELGSKCRTPAPPQRRWLGDWNRKGHEDFAKNREGVLVDLQLAFADLASYFASVAVLSFDEDNPRERPSPRHNSCRETRPPAARAWCRVWTRSNHWQHDWGGNLSRTRRDSKRVAGSVAISRCLDCRWPLRFAWRDLFVGTRRDDPAFGRAIRFRALCVGRVCRVHSWVERLDLNLWFACRSLTCDWRICRRAIPRAERESRGDRRHRGDPFRTPAVAWDRLGQYDPKLYQLTQGPCFPGSDSHSFCSRSWWFLYSTIDHWRNRGIFLNRCSGSFFTGCDLYLRWLGRSHLFFRRGEESGTRHSARDVRWSAFSCCDLPVGQSRATLRVAGFGNCGPGLCRRRGGASDLRTSRKHHLSDVNAAFDAQCNQRLSFDVYTRVVCNKSRWTVYKESCGSQ